MAAIARREKVLIPSNQFLPLGPRWSSLHHKEAKKDQFSTSFRPFLPTTDKHMRQELGGLVLLFSVSHLFLCVNSSLLQAL